MSPPPFEPHVPPALPALAAATARAAQPEPLANLIGRRCHNMVAGMAGLCGAALLAATAAGMSATVLTVASFIAVVFGLLCLRCTLGMQAACAQYEAAVTQQRQTDLAAVRAQARHEAAATYRSDLLRLQRLDELSSDWYWEQDETLRFTLLMTSGRKAADFSDSVVGRRRLDVVDPRLTDVDTHRRVLQAREPFRDFEYAVRQADGSHRWFMTTGKPIFDQATGAFTGYVGVGSEITERKRAELALRRQAEVLEAILRNLPGGLSLIDEHLRLVAWNTQFIDLMGLLPSLFEQPLPSLQTVLRHGAERGEFGHGDAAAVIEPWLARARAPQPHRLEHRRPNGAVIEVVDTPIDTGGVVTLYFDRTAERAAAEAIRRADMSFRTLFSMFPVGVAVVDHASGELMMANDRLCTVADAVRATTGDGAVVNIGNLIRSDSAPYGPAFRELWQALPQHGVFGPLDIDVVTERGEPVSSVMHGTFVRHGDAPPTVIVTIQDISERKANEHRLWQLARMDALTGLPNRAALRERLECALAEARGSKELFAVGLVDLDRFKEINDSFGHGVGDEYLKTIARRLAASLRPDDVVCRLGGDEFALILRNLGSLAGIQRPLQDVTRALNDKVLLLPNVQRGGGSIGVALYPADGENTDDLLRNADIALYSAKAAGRGRSHVFEAPMRRAHDEAVTTRTSIEAALVNDQIGVFYQPITRAGELTPLGFEALVRWIHPERGPLAPGAFIAAFDDPALVARIDRRVRERVFADAARWRREGIEVGRLGVNLAGGDFADGMLVREFQDLLAQHNLAGGSFCVEVTEGMFLGHDTGTIGAQLQALRALGVEIAFDDFGTGFASLSHLRKYPIDRLKIDRSFVSGMDRSPDAATIVRAVIQMAHNLGLKTTAEGVETTQELDLLRQFGCDQVQGYLLGRPVPAAEVPACLARLQAASAATLAAHGSEAATVLGLNRRVDATAARSRAQRKG